MAQFDLLPIELQASIVELRAAGAPETLVAPLVERMLVALATKSNKVQVEVWQMEERLGKQLGQIGDKLQGDIQTQLGATNGMLIDLHAAQMTAQPLLEEAGRGIADIKKSWEELSSWRSRVEATLASFAESRDESKTERAQIQKTVSALHARLADIERLLEIASEHEAGSGR